MLRLRSYYFEVVIIPGAFRKQDTFHQVQRGHINNYVEPKKLLLAHEDHLWSEKEAPVYISAEQPDSCSFSLRGIE
jgi:hypothetical protein